jgi:hypothetical protein
MYPYEQYGKKVSRHLNGHHVSAGIGHSLCSIRKRSVTSASESHRPEGRTAKNGAGVLG